MIKKILLLAFSFFILCSFCSCGSQNRLDALQKAFDKAGYETEAPALLEEGIWYLRVVVTLDVADQVTSPDDIVYYEAYIMYYEDSAAAETAYQNMSSSGIGGEAVRKGNYILSYISVDPFADGYRQIFSQVLD